MNPIVTLLHHLDFKDMSVAFNNVANINYTV